MLFTVEISFNGLHFEVVRSFVFVFSMFDWACSIFLENVLEGEATTIGKIRI